MLTTIWTNLSKSVINQGFYYTKKPPGWLGPVEKGVITLERSKMKNKKVVVGYVYNITDNNLSVIKITLYLN